MFQQAQQLAIQQVFEKVGSRGGPVGLDYHSLSPHKVLSREPSTQGSNFIPMTLLPVPECSWGSQESLLHSRGCS